MSELTDTIVHVAYRFKPEGSDKYITAYLETSLCDVIIPEGSRSAMMDASNMQEFCDLLMNRINQERPLYQKASKYDKNRVYPANKFLYESDTGKMKVGDGRNKYVALNYFGYAAGSSEGEYTATGGDVSLTITDEHGVETTTIVPDTIDLLATDPDPATYGEDAYALKTGEEGDASGTITGGGEG